MRMGIGAFLEKYFSSSHSKRNMLPDFRSFKEKNGANSRLTSMHHFYLFIRKIIVVER